MTPDEACLALGVSKKRRKRRRQLRKALAQAHAERCLKAEDDARQAIQDWAFQALALGGLAVAVRGPIWAVHVATAFGALAALVASLITHRSRGWHKGWQQRVHLLECAADRLPVQTLPSDEGACDRTPALAHERFLWLLTAGWTAGFVVSVVAIGHDRLALGQAACELVAFALACAWLMEPIGPKVRTG